MRKKIVYIVGDLSYPNGMSRVLSQKVNYLAEHTDYELYVVLTEKASEPHYYPLSPKVNVVNFDINYEIIQTAPLIRKIWLYSIKTRKYRRMLTDYLMKIRPDITVSVLRREINFINKISDGSRKVGELHFNRQTYRAFHNRWLPTSVNHLITFYWQQSLEREIHQLDKFIVLTHEDFENWRGLSNIMVIPNPIYCYPDHGSACTNRQVIAVGRYTWQKGFDLLIKAWVSVHQKHPNWTLHIYGAGDPRYYQQMVLDNNLKKSVFCEEATNNIYSRYDESSIFVLSSRYEGLPLVLIEAMSAGLPCVSFTCPCGPRDCIDDGQDGILVESGNIIKLGESICYLIEHDDVRKTYGAAARQKALRFLEGEIMQKWIRLFESL